MRRKIEQMQGEVNEFMDYVKRELARGIDDWEQRLGTALVKSSPTDLVRRNPPSPPHEAEKPKVKSLEVGQTNSRLPTSNFSLTSNFEVRTRPSHFRVTICRALRDL